MPNNSVYVGGHEIVPEIEPGLNWTLGQESETLPLNQPAQFISMTITGLTPHTIMNVEIYSSKHMRDILSSQVMSSQYLFIVGWSNIVNISYV